MKTQESLRQLESIRANAASEQKSVFRYSIALKDDNQPTNITLREKLVNDFDLFLPTRTSHLQSILYSEQSYVHSNT